MGLLTSLNSLPNFFGASSNASHEGQNAEPSVETRNLYHYICLYYKHTIHVIAFFTIVSLMIYGQLSQKEKCYHIDIGHDHLTTTLIYIVICVKFTVILPLPQILCNILGLVFFNTFPGPIELNKPKLRFVVNGSATNGDGARTNNIPAIDITTITPRKSLDMPHLCFRVVTRGHYPDLVQNNVRKNFLTCIESGLINFSIEVVTDKDIRLMPGDRRIKQLVVPTTYKTSTGALFKARALQYALEPGNSEVGDNDYIVHLDEETLLTHNVINGIANFSLAGRHHFGQGLITYANIEIVNLFTTLSDSYRVADDMGKVRFTLGALHKPTFGWKGSFVVTKCSAERDVSFDHGPDGSIAEDCYFSMVALNKGYSFDFIEGEMYEKSPFTILDLIRQRKRWVQGIWLVVHSSKIPIQTKFFLAMSHYAWLTLPLTTFSYVITLIVDLPSPQWLQLLGTFCFSVTLYMYIFGLVKSFHLRRSSIGILFVYLIAQLLTVSLNMIVENIAVFWGIFSPKHNFYIVKKDLERKALPDV